MKRYTDNLNAVRDSLHALQSVWDDYAYARGIYETARRRHVTPDNAVSTYTWLGHATQVYQVQRARLRIAHRDYKKAMRHFLEYKLD